MLRSALVTIALGLHLCVLVYAGNPKTAVAVIPTDTQPLINREQEIELALKAAPVHLRKDATVFVFTKNGYEKVRTGSNGFNCMVNRDGIQNGNNALLPTCWDPEGSRTILPVMLRVGELLAQNKSAAEIKRDIDEGFAQGRFHSPAKAGIAYMLAGDIQFDPKTGQTSSTVFPPHYMLYAPGVTNADIGVTGAALKQTPGLPFVYSGYSGDTRTAYIIVPANQSAGHAMH
ncbi:MAG TPA: hypothetical protein VK557_01820 [Pyrinomonadaceae bacterium]|nr:hypothetical protein [Pyrinomonadaceae bacterium]